MLFPRVVDTFLSWLVDDLLFSGVADLPRWDDSFLFSGVADLPRWAPFSGAMNRAAGSWSLLRADVVLLDEELSFFLGVVDLLRVVVSDELLLLDELLLEELLDEDKFG